MSTAKAALLAGFKKEHTHLDTGLVSVTEVLDRLRSGVDAGLLKSLGETDRFFQQMLVPHAEWEELTFYPAMRDLVAQHGDPNAGMLIDHQEILARITEFTALLRRIQDGERDPDLFDQARILGYQIRALVEVHCRKEEEIYCGLLRRHLSDGDVVHALAIGDQMGHD